MSLSLIFLIQYSIQGVINKINRNLVSKIVSILWGYITLRKNYFSGIAKIIISHFQILSICQIFSVEVLKEFVHKSGEPYQFFNNSL